MASCGSITVVVSEIAFGRVQVNNAIACQTQLMNLPQTQILGLALLILVAGCDKNKDKQDIEKQKSDAQISLAKRVLAEKEEAVKIRSNDEFEAFKRANTLFNLREYETAVSAYHEFIRDYSLSPRTVIAQQRLQDAERIMLKP